MVAVMLAEHVAATETVLWAVVTGLIEWAAGKVVVVVTDRNCSHLKQCL